MIELAVFVDEVLYGNTKKKGSSDPISAIQDIVFTYINSVRGHSNNTWHSKGGGEGGGFYEMSHKPFLHFETRFLVLLEVKTFV